MSLATLGVLCTLSAGGGVWSALTGPRVADVQLHVAASNTVAAASFVATVDAKINETESGSLGSPTVGGTAPQTRISSSKETIVYQAPDRVLVKESSAINGQSAPDTEETQIGSSCWQSASASGQQQQCQANAVSMFLEIVRVLEKTSKVSYRDGKYQLTAADSLTFLNDALGGTGGGPAPKNLVVQVRIDGSNVSSEHISFTEGESEGAGSPSISLTADIDATFTEIGSARRWCALRVRRPRPGSSEDRGRASPETTLLWAQQCLGADGRTRPRAL